MMQNDNAASSAVLCDKCAGCDALYPFACVRQLTPAAWSRAVAPGFYMVVLRGRTPGPDCGREGCDYTAGTATFLAPGHCFCPSGPSLSAGAAAFGLSFHTCLMERVAPSDGRNYFSFFGYAEEESLHLSARELGVLLGCLEGIADELHWGVDAFTDALVTDKVSLFLHYCKRFYTRQFITRGEPNRRLLALVERRVEAALREGRVAAGGQPSAASLASDVCCSPAYLDDLLRHETGFSTAEYVRRRCFDHARHLLLTTRLPVAEVARRSGFVGGRGFAGLFARLTGHSPSAYRRRGVGKV